MTYDPKDWFWFVGDDRTRVWSSAAHSYLPADDKAFNDWLALGNKPTRIASEDDLWGVLEEQFPAGLPVTAASQASMLLAGGLTITSKTTPALDGTYPCDPQSLVTVAQIVVGLVAGYGFPGSGDTFDFAVSKGQAITFTDQAQFLKVAVAIRDFVYHCYQVIAGRSDVLPPAQVTLD